jgi:hypothetical protein
MNEKNNELVIKSLKRSHLKSICSETCAKVLLKAKHFSYFKKHFKKVFSKIFLKFLSLKFRSALSGKLKNLLI